MPAEFFFYPFDDGPGEDSMENRWEAMMQFMRTTGILLPWGQTTLDPSAGDLAVTATGGLSVQTAIGEAWIHGFMFQQTNDYYPVIISPNESGNPRIDLVTARLDTDANTIVIHVEEGVPDPSPVAPTPVESTPIWDLPLAEVLVADGAANILPEDITDVRVRSVQGDGGSSAVTLASAGGTETLVSGTGIGPNLLCKGITSGSNITLTSDADQITMAYNTPYCRVTETSPASWVNGENNFLFYTTNLNDPTGMHNTSVDTEKFNILVTGIYTINLTVQIASPGAMTGPVYIYIVSSLQGILTSNVITSGDLIASSSCTVPLTAGEFFYTSMVNHSGFTITPVYEPSYTPVASVMYVGQL